MKNINTVTKHAMTNENGEAPLSVRFSVSQMYRMVDGREVCDLSVAVERKTRGWELVPGREMSAPALPADETGKYAGTPAVVAVDFMTELHTAMLGHAPVGRFLKMDAPK